jgi:hypothetical protein
MLALLSLCSRSRGRTSVCAAFFVVVLWQFFNPYDA